MMFSYLGETDSSSDSMAYAGSVGKIFLIIISILGIFINSVFSIDYLKKIIKTKNKDNAGVSSVEKILCVIAIVETLISVFWLINNIFMNDSKADDGCKTIAYFEIFLYLFDWSILSTSLYQIKLILLNPQEILDSGKRVFKYIIGCAIISLADLGVALGGNLGGRSPMLTCFVTLDGIKSYKIALFFIFFAVPLLCLFFGIFQIYLIRRSVEYKNDRNNREFFIEYSYFVITYIFSSLLLIVVYVINYIIRKEYGKNYRNIGYIVFIAISTFLTCSTPLIVGVIRYYRTGLLKRICNFCKKRRVNNNLIEERNEEEEQNIIGFEEGTEENRMFQIEKTILEKLIIKYFTAVSFALGKSKYKEEEEEDDKNKNENLSIEEKKDYKIDGEEILKDLDLAINDDIKVLGEANIDIEVTEYNSSLFKKLRRLEGLNEDKIIEMFQPKKGTNQLIHRVNDSLYINSSNKLLMLKKIKKEKMFFFQNNILPNLYEYFVNNPNSIICRIFGLYRIKIESNEEEYIALIYNIQESIISDELGFIEDEILQMKLSENEFRANLVIGLKTNDSSGNFVSGGTIVSHNLEVVTTYREKKKKFFKLYLSEQDNDTLNKVLEKDIEFFTSKNNNGFHFHVFEKELKGINFNLNSGEDSLEESKKINESSPKIKNEIKKYVFNSNKPDSIYCICISGI